MAEYYIILKVSPKSPTRALQNIARDECGAVLMCHTPLETPLPTETTQGVQLWGQVQFKSRTKSLFEYMPSVTVPWK